MRSAKLWMFIILLVAILGSDASAQAVPAQINEPHGDQPFGAFQATDIDNIGFANGAVDVKIPLFSHSGRGLAHQKFWTYTSKAWAEVSDPPCDPTIAQCPPPNPAIWTYTNNTVTLSQIQQYRSSGCGDGHMHSEWTNFTYVDPQGTPHTFDAVISVQTPVPNCIHPKAVGYSLDNSGMKFNSSTGVVTLKDGTTVQAGGTLFKDPNGNFITVAGNPSTSETDTLGRNIQHLTGTLPDGAQYEDWIAKDSAGSSQTARIEWAMLPVCTAFHYPSDSTEACPGGIKVARKIVLPNGLAYQFTYDTGTTPGHYGELLRIDLPAGGYIRYEYAQISPSFPRIRAVTKRVVSADGTAASEKSWTYSYQLDTPDFSHNTTIVTDPAGNQTAHVTLDTLEAVGSWVPLETETRFYQGTTSGTLLRTVKTDYAALSVSVGDSDDGISNLRQLARPIRVTTILDNGQTSKVETDYDPLPDNNGVISFSRSNVVEKREYDYGQGVPGALLRRTTYTYLHNANGAYANVNIVDKVLNTTVYNGVGTIVAQTQNAYDGTPLANTNAGTCQSPSGAPNHDYCAFGTGNLTRGNLTSVSRWRNTDNTWLTTNYSYDDLGNVVATTDPGGHQTTLNYSDSWSGASCIAPGVNTYAFLTQVTNALNQRTQATYYSCPGLVQSKRNENDILAGRSGTTFTYDGMNRMLTATAPDGGLTSLNYHGDALPLTVTKTQTATPAPSILSSVVYDGLGKVKTTSLDSDPVGADIVDTTYDALGRLATVSNPYRSTSDSIYGTTQTQYDALSRPVQVTKQDGSISTVSYNGNCTTGTDESGRPRQSCSDALGRLIQVQEPNAVSPATSGTGWVGISGSEQTGTSNVTITVANAGFETPVVGSGAFQYGPTGGSWTFAGNSGITGNGSGFTVSNPVAPEGVQVAFLQMGSASLISQSVSGFQTGVTYTVTFKAAQRGNMNQGGQDFDVYLDSTLLATFRPASSSYATLSTPAFTTTAGNHTLKFQGRDSSGGDNTAFIDAVSVTGTSTVADTGTVTITVGGTPYSYNYGAGDTASTVANGLTNAINAGSLVRAVATTNGNVTVANAGFETPVVGAGSFQYGPSGGSWTFSGAGLSGNGSGFTSGNPAAPEGAQVAFLQGTGFISQSLAGFQSGVSYTLSFKAAQRGNFSVGGQDFDVYLDSTFVARFHPSGTSYVTYSTPAFTTTTGSHTLKFQGLDFSGQGDTAFIDAVTVTAPSGSVVSLTSVVTGTATNYTLTTSSSGIFVPPSFAVSRSGATLTGGSSFNLSNNPYVTLYSYDALGNLLRVDQKGSAPSDSSQWRTRLFTYNSLSQLLTANNPESGTISYVYDNDGELLMKTSPAANQTGTATQTVSYCYDELHRVTKKDYLPHTYNPPACPITAPVVSYIYDSGTNAKGHLTQMTDQAGTGTYGYDIMERLATETRTLIGANNASISKNISYSYNLDGSVKTLTYPSGKIITYTSDAAGRVLSAVDSGSGINYATGSTYGPDGALTGFVSGSGGAAAITNSFSYNKRLQPLAMSATVGAQTVFSINYDFRAGNGTPGSGMDNGNVWGIVNNKDTTRTQTFTYDSLNRLSSAQNSGTDCNVMVLENKKKFWGNNYTYDAWGNLTTKALIQTPIPTCSGENLSVTVGLDNRLGSGYLYDAAGNMTFNATPPTQNYTWDQENRLTGAAGYTYTYDGDGSRVRKSNGNLAANGTLYWYMTPGVVAESDLAGTTKSEYIFFDGGRVARRDGPTGAGGVFYYFSDHLKTASVITDSAGVIKAESDYYPWGGELKYVDNDANDYKFTGKKHDLETRLDYFGARYYANELGRFITPDWAAKAAAVPYADLADPQSLNLYSYVRNRPTVMADADGHTGETPQINGPPVVVDNGNGTSTATQVVQTKNDGKQVTLPNGETGNKITTTTTTYIATFDERNQIVDGSASKQSTITTQTYDSDGKAIGKPKTTTGPVQQLGNNNIKNGLNARDEKAFTSMQAATWHWENVSIGSIAGALSPLVPGYGGKALGMLSGISDIQFYDVSKAMSWGMSQGGWPPKGQYDLNQRTLPYMPLAH